MKPTKTKAVIKYCTLTFLCLSAFACGPRTAPDYSHWESPALLKDVDQLPADFLLHQEVRANFGGREVAFQAVVQKQNSVLRVVTLSADGSRASLVEQRGTSVHSEQYIEQRLPFEPWHALLDVHRAYFLSARNTSAKSDGVFSKVRQGERIEETWRDGQVAQRRFYKIHVSDSSQKETLIAQVDYGKGDGDILQRSLRFENKLVGYILEIHPLSYTQLPSTQDQGDTSLPEESALPSSARPAPSAGASQNL